MSLMEVDFAIGVTVTFLRINLYLTRRDSCRIIPRPRRKGSAVSTRPAPLCRLSIAADVANRIAGNRPLNRPRSAEGGRPGQQHRREGPVRGLKEFWRKD